MNTFSIAAPTSVTFVSVVLHYQLLWRHTPSLLQPSRCLFIGNENSLYRLSYEAHVICIVLISQSRNVKILMEAHMEGSLYGRKPVWKEAWVEGSLDGGKPG